MQPFRKILFAAPPKIQILRWRTFVNRLFGGTEHVLSRRMCAFRYRRLQSEDIKREVLKALVFEAEMGSSEDVTGIHISISGIHAQIWTWDGSLNGLAPRSANCSAVPETLLHPKSDGFALRRCLEGVEGQYWSDGVMTASRWWSDVPSVTDWTRFCRSSGAAVSDELIDVPEVEPGVKWSIKAPRNRVPMEYVGKQLSWTHALAAVAAILALPFAYYATKNAFITFQAIQYGAAQAQLTEITGARRSTSRQIDALSSQIAPFEEIVRVNDPLAAIAPVLEALEANESSLQRFQFQDGVLELTFRATGTLSEPELVQSLEAVESLVDVRLEARGRSNNWVLRAELVEVENG
ncbi:MAG: hypothetical protein AAF950_01260 [Pseudomonadota bacterium]